MTAAPSRKKPAERREFILHYLREQNRTLYPQRVGRATVDILDSDFVNAYIDFSGARFEPVKYGAFKCKQLSRDLTEMWQTGELSRKLISLPEGSRNEGFPGWVYAYEL